MRTSQIDHTDLTVSRLAFGCAMLGINWNDPEFVRKSLPVIHVAYENGITFFDTADVYGWGKSELALAEAMRKRPEMRRSVVIQTKCGDRFRDAGVVDNSRKHIESSAEGSLKRLGLDCIDILLLHWPDSLVEPDEVAAAFDALQQAGKVRYFGVSNHNPAQIEILKKSVRQRIIFNQIQLGLAHWNTSPERWKSQFTHDDEGVSTLNYCRVNGIRVQAYSPLRASNIGKRPNLLNPSPDASAEVKQAALAIQNLASKYSVKPSAIMLAWLLRHPAGIVPIIGTTKVEHVVENCAADRVNLSREEWYKLLDLATAISSQAQQRPT